MILNNKVALITGGSRGIGSEIVRQCAKEGAHVAFTYRSSADRAASLASECSINDVEVKAYASDAASYINSQDLVQQVLSDFGRIDILINNAGITRDNLLLRMSEKEWDEVIDNNLKSVFNMTKHISRPMMKNRDGVIINIGSVVGVFGNAGQTNYAASKSGLIGFSKSIAKELGSRNIRCNVIAPGFIQTDMTEKLNEEQEKNYLANIPLKSFGKATDVADLCVFLASDRAKYITGQVISVCGGMNM